MRQVNPLCTTGHEWLVHLHRRDRRPQRRNPQKGVQGPGAHSSSGRHTARRRYLHIHVSMNINNNDKTTATTAPTTSTATTVSINVHTIIIMIIMRTKRSNFNYNEVKEKRKNVENKGMVLITQPSAKITSRQNYRMTKS